MNNITKIGTFEAISFLVIVMINRIILNNPKEIVDSVGASAWINVIVISVVAILFVLVISKLYKNFIGKDILDISEYLGGKFLKKTVCLIFGLILLYIAAIVLRNFSDSLQKIFLVNAPVTYIMFFFLIGMIVINKLGFSTIAKINLFNVIIIFLSILVIFIAPIRFYDISNLFPIFGNGIDETFFSGLTNIFVFSGIGYLYFIMPYLDKPQKFKKIAVISIIISSVYLLLSVLSLIGLFSYLITSDDFFSVLLITRIISLGNVFDRVDAIFLLVWILTFLVYLSFILYFLLYLYKNLANNSEQNGPIYLISTLIFVLGLLPENVIEINFLENKILKYIILIFLFILPLILFILANLKYKRKNKIPIKREEF